MARRSEHSLEELMAMVLNAAETIVIEEGFPALKARKIAAEIGYTVGSIYMVFTNMADLIMHINARTLDAIAAQLEQVQDRTIETLAMAYLNYASQNFNRWRMIFDFRLPPDTALPGWYQVKINILLATLEAQFAEQAPELSEDHRRRAARALWCGIHGICVLSITGEQDKASLKDTEEMVALLLRNFIRGYACSQIIEK